MYIRFLRAEFVESDGRVALFIEPVAEAPPYGRRLARRATRENIGDFNRPAGLLHFLRTRAPMMRIRLIQLRSPQKILFQFSVMPTARSLGQVKRPSSLQRTEAFTRIIRASQPHLGAPLIWGHNRGHGDLGFDPFTFAFHVYKKALCLPIVEASQLSRLGCALDFHAHSLIPGDLLVFANGRHVAIYTGAGQVISVGGGSGNVGYQRLQGGRYNLSNLTMVRRLF